MLDHGIRKITVAEIAKAAGVGKGTVHLHWPSKEDLIVGLFAPSKAPSDASVATAAQEVITAMNVTRAAVLELIERTQTNGA